MKHGLSKETVTDSDESGSESSRSSTPPKEVSKVEKKKLRKDKSEPEAKSKSKSKSKKKAPAPKSDSRSSESESESSSESEPERKASKDQVSKKSAGKRVTIQESNETVSPIPAKAYKPPEGFQFLKKASSQSTPIPQIFSNLDGKQIWHITAPLGVPVSSIEQLALEAVAKGEPILTHKGVKYRLHEDPVGAEKTKSLLLPDKHGNVFRRNRQGVAQTFHIEQVVDLPNGDLSVAPHDINTLKKKAPKQPKNLRMRYKPFGSSNEQPETFGSASEESEAEIRSFKEPAGAHLDKSSKKRKHAKVESSIRDESDMESSSQDESTRKKPKKTASEVPDSSPHATKSSKKDAKRGREEKQRSPEVRKKHREETSLERRARREERKRKKQQK